VEERRRGGPLNISKTGRRKGDFKGFFLGLTVYSNRKGLYKPLWTVIRYSEAREEAAFHGRYQEQRETVFSPGGGEENERRTPFSV